MARTIDNMKAQLEFGGARPSLFEVTVLPPAIGEALSMLPKLTFMCKAASLPQAVQGVVEVPYQGRKIKVAGNRTFPEWQITVINDEDFIIRNAFESWQKAINLHRENVRGLGATAAPASYKGRAEVNQLGKEGNLLRSYFFEGVWPSEVAAIPLDWGTVDAIEEFTVSLQYDLWDISSVLAR